MATLLFLPMPEFGHLQPTMFVASKLRDRGHRVVFLVLKGVHDLIEERGFEVERMFVTDTDADRFQREFQLGMIEYCQSGAFEERYKLLHDKYHPDLAFLDIMLPHPGPVFYKYSVPRIYIHTSVPEYNEEGVPPGWSDALPDEFDRYDANYLYRIQETMFLGHDPSIEFLQTMLLDFVDYLKRCGLGWSATTDWRRLMADPELVCVSASLDFPRTASALRAYAGPCLEPNQEGWEWPDRDPAKPLIFCSLGSQPQNYPEAADILRDLVSLAKKRPDLQFVIGGKDDMLKPLEPSSNVFHAEWLPQRAVLEQASVFVSHMGMGSFKEAVWAGVPVIGVPQAFDQRGNAARAYYHGLGERFCLDEERSETALNDKINAVLADPDKKEAAIRMSKLLQASEELDPALDFIEAHLEGRLPVRGPKTLKAEIRNLQEQCAGEEIPL